MTACDTDAHNEQNDHADGVMPLYAGTRVIGEAANFALADGRHNAMRWHEFSRTDALAAEPLIEEPDDDDLEDPDEYDKAADDNAARATQGASAGA